MKEFIIQVPEKKSKFLLELINSLGFNEAKEIVQTRDIEIPEAHKTLVRKRIQSAKPSDILDWEEAKKQIRVD